MDHKGKVALVTGSTSGIGLGIAKALAQTGADICLHGFADKSTVDAILAELKAIHSGRVTYSDADVGKPSGVREVIEHCASTLGACDILVNNAGIQHTAAIEDFPDEQWDRIIAINLSAVFHAMKFAIPAMKAKKWGRIVNIASAHGLVASRDKVAYVAAKHGVVGATKVAAIELANSGITANAICPGWVLTPLVQKQLEARAASSGKSLDDVKHDLLAEKQPMIQFSTPESIGATTVFLCSDSASTITGSALSVDGGWTAQ